MQLLVQGLKHNFKYQIGLIELYYREQWTDKNFVLHIVKFVCQVLVLLLNIKLCYWIFIRGHFPIYLIGEIIDTTQELN